jgi:hypothetical protein
MSIQRTWHAVVIGAGLVRRGLLASIGSCREIAQPQTVRAREQRRQASIER